MNTAEAAAAVTKEPKVMESLLLSVGHHWSRRETVEQQVELIGRHFSQSEMLGNQKELIKLVGLPAPRKRHPTAARTATKAQADDVLNALKVLGGQYKLLVQSDDLPTVQILGALSEGDEHGAVPGACRPMRIVAHIPKKSC